MRQTWLQNKKKVAQCNQIIVPKQKSETTSNRPLFNEPDSLTQKKVLTAKLNVLLIKSALKNRKHFSV